MANIVTLGPLELVVAALLACAAAALSMVKSLGLQRALLISAMRMAIQLLLVGYLLGLVFRYNHMLVTIVVMLIMLVAASYEAGARRKRRLKLRDYAANCLMIGASTLGIGLIGIATLANKDHSIIDAQHIVPIFGIVLGNAMNAAALALTQLDNQVSHQQRAIEAQLALGRSMHAATRQIRISTARSASIPIINQMAGAGIITLPGIMSGQLLAGQSPLQAALYQIFMLAMLMLVNICCVILAQRLYLRRITDPRQRLRLDKLPAAK